MNTIKLKYGLEEITSRIPGLFPYIEFDENHVATIHSASDSDSGCYGKIVCAMTIPEGVFLDGVIESNKSYTYSTLINTYYENKDSYPLSTFIQFMDRGIGKFNITADIDFEYCTLVPEYEYYANCGRLWDDYTKISIMCEKYIQMKETTGEINCELECLVEKYAKMGGDIMRDYYGSLINNANITSNEFLSYKSDDFNLSIDLNIVTSENDLGILNTFIEFFGLKYVNVLYVIEDRGVVRIVREVDPEDPTHPRSQDTMVSTEKYYLDEFCSIEAVDGVDYFLPGEFIVYNDRSYICNQPTINGEWDSTRFRLISEDYSTLEPDIDKAYYNPDTGATPSDTIEAITNSKLNGFVGETKYTDESGSVVYPQEGAYWLWFYRIGQIGYSETTTDMFNNIEIMDGFERIADTDGNHYETHLMAYGDIITNITRNKDDKTLTFTYVVGAHFKAKLLDIVPDDDGNDRYYYGEFEYDSNDSHGLIYNEVYNYEPDGEIDNMSDEFFEYFINHDKLELRQDDTVDPSIIVSARYTKAPFNTYTNTNYYTLSVNGEENINSYIVSDYSVSIQLDKYDIATPLTKFDYLSGIAYKPTVETDVYVSRGNASAWERHVKLGEIKTFEDLENSSLFGSMLRTS